MWLIEILFFTLCFAVLKYLWKFCQFYFRIFKIPNTSFSSSIKKIYKIVNGDTKFCFEQILTSLKVDGLSRSWVGPFVVVNVITPEDSKIIFTSKSCIDKPYFMKKYMRFQHGTLFGNIEPWRSHRKVLNPFFGFQYIRTIIPMFNKKVKILINNLKKMEGKGEFNIFYFMAAATLDNILSLMELDLDIQNKDVKERDVFMKNVDRYSEIAILRIMKFWLYSDFLFNLSSLGKKHKEVKSNVEESLVLKAIKNIRENPQNEDNKKNFIRALMDPKNNFTEKEIHDEILTIITAAQGTSAIAASTVLLMLAMHKKNQIKVLNELKQVIGNEIEHLDFEKLNELEYLEMVINESLRLFPVVPLILKRSDEDLITTEGYTIPAGSNILISIYNIHRSKTVWGDDAEIFKPERFEKENFEKIHPYAFTPFSKGPRMCLAFRYAKILMKIQIANILMRYEIDTSLNFNELELKLNLSSIVCQGYMVALKKL